MPPARLTNYVFAHSKYSSGLGQRGVLADYAHRGATSSRLRCRASGGARRSMIEIARARSTHWLVPCAMVGALLSALPAALPEAPTIRASGWRK